MCFGNRLFFPSKNTHPGKMARQIDKNYVILMMFGQKNDQTCSGPAFFAVISAVSKYVRTASNGFPAFFVKKNGKKTYSHFFKFGVLNLASWTNFRRCQI